ncbi:MAG: NUDIX domain-containing protein [Trebonia sp.]
MASAAERELAEETGIDPGSVSCLSQAPVYVEYGRVPARPEKDEPEHFHLDFGFAFTTADGDVGRIQESEVTGAGLCPLAEAERLVGHRRASCKRTTGRAALNTSALRRITCLLTGAASARTAHGRAPQAASSRVTLAGSVSGQPLYAGRLTFHPRRTARPARGPAPARS